MVPPLVNGTFAPTSLNTLFLFNHRRVSAGGRSSSCRGGPAAPVGLRSARVSPSASSTTTPAASARFGAEERRAAAEGTSAENNSKVRELDSPAPFSVRLIIQ